MITKAQARALRQAIVTASASLSDEEALSAPMMFDKWKEDTAYSAGNRVRYEGILYKCLQAHTSQTTWNPADAVSLWARVLIPDPEVIPEWIQPDSTNPYMKGDKVTHNGKTWESAVDNNVWEPGAVGTETLWIEVI